MAEVARRFGEVRLKVTGTSMLPAIWPNDILIVSSCTLSELSPGKIALYQRKGALVAHRITHVFDDHLITRGDSVSQNDAPVPEFEIVGRVVSIVRRGRPVSDRPSVLNRLGSRILRHSYLCLRATLLMARCFRSSENAETSWA